VVSEQPEDTGELLRRLALGFNAATGSGRDDDLWTVQTAAESAWAGGVHHGDLALLLVQLYLDCHAVTAAGRVLAAAPRAAVTPTGQMLRAGMLLQCGDTLTAGSVLLDLVAAEPTWRSLALLAAVYEDLADPAAADLLYAEAAEELDAKQLSSLAWLEGRRARLRLGSGALDRADQHLRRAEWAAPGWSVAAVRAAWLTAAGEPGDAAAVWREVAGVTGRPDHAQEAGMAVSRQGGAAEASGWWARARHGYGHAGRRWPYRYAHHLVEWHLEVGHDPAAAVEVALADYQQRPAARQAGRLAAAWKAAGEGQRAQRLLVHHDQQQARDRAGLAAAVARLNATARRAA
jgi:hypothetical protein